VLGEQPAATATKESLVQAMGLASHQSELVDERGHDEIPAPARTATPGQTVVTIEQPGAAAGLDRIELRTGEIVGFAGLEGHGQLPVLEAMLGSSAARSGKPGSRKRTRGQAVTVVGDAAYVSGDRGVRGIFPQWDSGKNLTFSSLKRLTVAGVIRPGAEKRMIDTWWDGLAIKGRPSDLITSLSGGTQQKALMGRAIAQDAGLLLLEDPTRGVDQATKDDVYALLRRQADAGQCVVWYSTENEELRNCDRVLVFQGGTIIASLDEAPTEDEILALSFQSEAGDAAPADAGPAAGATR
jgi:ribose transport system ATP-binding protein